MFFKVAAAITSAAILASCGVRDEQSSGGEKSASYIGSDTSAIAGFWEPNVGNSWYVLIDDIGRWSYLRNSDTDNCFDLATYPVTKLAEDTYEIQDLGATYSFIGVIQPSGQLRIDILPLADNNATYDPVTGFVPRDLQICNNNEGSSEELRWLASVPQ